MDLMAYVQIEDLDKVAKANGIEVPRLRGYRLMKDEQAVPEAEIERMVKDQEIEELQMLCRAEPFWSVNAHCFAYTRLADRIVDSYLVKGKDENGDTVYTGIRWDKIHGKKRKALKFAIKRSTKRVREQFNMWNKYAGREDVLYIHSRIGGGNWDFYNGDELTKKPWFLGKVDDYFDQSYCDIYAAIKV